MPFAKMCWELTYIEKFNCQAMFNFPQNVYGNNR